MSEAERWRPVLGFEGLYEVSDQGRVRSLDRVIMQTGAANSYVHEGRLLKQQVGKNGYPSVTLSRSGEKRLRTVHTLVAEAFIGARPYASAHARHLNDVKTDNRSVNLEWGSTSDNMHDRTRNGIHWNANKTHCAQGHPFTPENTLVLTKGRSTTRRCRECKRVVTQRHDAKRIRSRQVS